MSLIYGQHALKIKDLSIVLILILLLLYVKKKSLTFTQPFPAPYYCLLVHAQVHGGGDSTKSEHIPTNVDGQRGGHHQRRLTTRVSFILFFSLLRKMVQKTLSFQFNSHQTKSM